MKTVKSHGGLKSAPFEPDDVRAIQAVIAGTADPYLQRRAMQWIVESACRVHDISFTPGDPYMTSFQDGQRFVAKQIAELLRTNVTKLVEQLRRKEDEAEK